MGTQAGQRRWGPSASPKPKGWIQSPYPCQPCAPGALPPPGASALRALGPRVVDTKAQASVSQTVPAQDAEGTEARPGFFAQLQGNLRGG